VVVGQVGYRSDGETRGKDFSRPVGVRRGEGFPERRRRSSWSIGSFALGSWGRRLASM